MDIRRLESKTQSESMFFGGQDGDLDISRFPFSSAHLAEILPAIVAMDVVILLSYPRTSINSPVEKEQTLNKWPSTHLLILGCSLLFACRARPIVHHSIQSVVHQSPNMSPLQAI